MQFELTEALIDDILFSMENQDMEFYLDTKEGVVVSPNDDEFLGQEEEESDSRENWIDLPHWESSDGFRLMEKFAAGLRNPLVREELSSALDRGRGVFRAFKDVLSRYPEIEQLWFSFKEKEMRRAILTWYNGLREEWGLALVGEEPEETEDLVLEDFTFRTATAEDADKAGELHRICVAELESAPVPPDRITEKKSQWIFPGTVSVVAETGKRDFAGYGTGILKDGTLQVSALEVRPEYRGLGIGEKLLEILLKRVTEHDFTHVCMDLPLASEGFSRVLLRFGFYVYESRYALKRESKNLLE
jgi:ribosomal protein S18 acetylase RimI-like enzyme